MALVRLLDNMRHSQQPVSSQEFLHECVNQGNGLWQHGVQSCASEFLEHLLEVLPFVDGLFSRYQIQISCSICNHTCYEMFPHAPEILRIPIVYSQTQQPTLMSARNDYQEAMNRHGPFLYPSCRNNSSHKTIFTERGRFSVFIIAREGPNNTLLHTPIQLTNGMNETRNPIAVVTHIGPTMTQGHYLAYIKKDQDSWLKANDSVVTSVPDLPVDETDHVIIITQT